MEISVKIPVVVRFDNVGTIFMASYITTTPHTKHMDVRYKYANEYAKDEVLKIIFAKSESNSNILTKNISAELHEKHSKKMIGEEPK